MDILGKETNPLQTLAIFIGAGVFRRAPRLAQGPAFHKSAEHFRDYLLQADGLALPHQNLEWLFNDARSPSEQLEDIGTFLDSRCSELKERGTPAQDLIVYYVGHGLFCGSDQHYCFAIRQTAERSEGLTSIRVSDLAAVIKDRARFLRKYFILDCCFAASAYRELQSGPLQTQRKKVLGELPQRGTTLLCSAGSQDASLAPEGLAHTMFSDSLLAVLCRGHRSLGPRLSLSELGDLIKDHLHEAYPERWVRPEIHSPDQSEGDIADIQLFPNPARLNITAQSSRRRPPVDRIPCDKAVGGTATPGQPPTTARTAGNDVGQTQCEIPACGIAAPREASPLSKHPRPPKSAAGAIGVKSLFLSRAGRISRRQWWLAIGLLVLATVIASSIRAPFLLVIVWGYPLPVLTIKRLHDIGVSSWWALSLLVLPFIPVVVIILGCIPGTIGESLFGSIRVFRWRKHAE